MSIDPLRTSLTRDEIIGNLLGWIQGPFIIDIPDDEYVSPDEMEYWESWTYLIWDARDRREADALNKSDELRESGQSEEIRRKPLEDFKREDEALRRFSDEVDDEISKGVNSMLRIDPRSSYAWVTCYTWKSVDEWIRARPDLSAKMPLSTAEQSRKKSKGQLQEEAILACFKRLKKEPTQLEPRDQGRSGIKRQIREMLVDKEPFPTSKIFDNAWQRLRDTNKIREAS